MIAKIKSGYHVKKLVEYHYKREKKSELIDTNMMAGAVSSNDIIKTLRDRNRENKIVAKPNFHVSLNFHKNDEKHLTNDFLKCIAE